MSSLILTCPEFLAMERSIIDDFVTCSSENCEEIEFCVKGLNQSKDEEYVHGLFRALHSMKGNCQMVGLTPFIEPLHRIEDIVSRIRSKQIEYQPIMGEFLLHCIDDVQDMIGELIANGEVDDSKRLQLCRVSEAILNNLNPQRAGEQFQKAMSVFGAQQRLKDLENKPKKTLLEAPPDLVMMRSLAGFIDNLNIFRRNRSDQLVVLLEQLNFAMGHPIDTEQLQAAAWMHDVGMSFIPHSIFNKEGSLSREELRKIQEHVVIGSQLLLRFGGWDEAARIVLDHHERFDGTGYPNGSAGDDIHLGARMVAIIDTFCSITAERSDRSYKRSLLSAISEINANAETQFDPAIVAVFNDVVRKMMIKTSG